jgi:imidazoleglycerol-phosphate dehydratase
MDEALSRVALDISGRPYLSFNADFSRCDDGSNVNPYLFEEFFRGLVNSSSITMHIDLIRGNNSHHILESIFKAFALAFKKAVKISGEGLPSTKGVI